MEYKCVDCGKIFWGVGKTKTKKCAKCRNKQSDVKEE